MPLEAILFSAKGLRVSVIVYKTDMQFSLGSLSIGPAYRDNMVSRRKKASVKRSRKAKPRRQTGGAGTFAAIVAAIPKLYNAAKSLWVPDRPDRARRERKRKMNAIKNADLIARGKAVMRAYYKRVADYKKAGGKFKVLEWSDSRRQKIPLQPKKFASLFRKVEKKNGKWY